MKTFVDSNILIDAVSDDERYANWSLNALDVAAARGDLACDPIVFAEVSIRFSDLDTCSAFFERSNISLEPTPQPALFLAGRAYLKYKERGGARGNVLPDFLIGAHAAVLGCPLITRDLKRYRTYFPNLPLIAPDTQP